MHKIENVSFVGLRNVGMR